MAFFDVIKKDKEDGNLVWKYPKTKFSTASQLVVHESQEAVFFANGKALDLFGAGKYTLDTNNIPLLKGLMQLPTGRKSPFECEVYFIDVSEQKTKWGTSTKIEFLEPKYNFPIAIGACGEIRFKIEDSRKLLIKLVGIKNNFNTQSIDEFFSSYILMNVKTYISQIITKEKICIFEIDQQLEKFSEELKELLQKDLNEFGIKLDKFIITTIAKPESDKTYLEFKELFFKQSVSVAQAKLRQEVSLIDEETEAQKKIISSKAEATKRMQEGYSYQEEKGFEIGKELAKNEAVGQFTNVGIGMGMISGIGGQVSNKVSEQVTTAMASVSGKVCPSCNTQNSETSSFCKKCGHNFNAPKVCINCGNVLQEDSVFCDKCGGRVN